MKEEERIPKFTVRISELVMWAIDLQNKKIR